MGMACELDAGSPAITAAAAPYMRKCERAGRSQGWNGAGDVRQIRLCALLPGASEVSRRFAQEGFGRARQRRRRSGGASPRNETVIKKIKISAILRSDSGQGATFCTGGVSR